MKTKFYFLLLSFISAAFITPKLYAGNATLTTSALAADTIYQGVNTNIVYAVKMDVTVSSATVTNIQYTLSGTHDADDFTYTSVYFNATAPIISGATYLGQVAATFAAPHTYSYAINRTITAGSSGYFIITVNTSTLASDNKTVSVNGATNPVVFSFSAATTVTNNQTNAAGTQTIQAAEVNLSTSAVAADTLYQGTNTNIIYVTKMDVSAMADVTLNNVQYTLSGTHDADDLSYTSIYFNATAPVISGATYLGQTVATFAAPHAYSYYINKFMARGSSGYFIITANVASAATDNKTIRITGATTPVAFSYTTAPNVTNSQNNGGGTQTIQAAEVNLSTSAVVADTLYQGTNTNIIYITKMDVSAMADVTLNNVQYTLSGTHDADDLSYTSIYFNATAPVISGATYLGQTVATFAAPHAYSYYINKFMARGSSGYFIITANVSATATDNKTIRITGATTPVTFSYTTAPNVTNSQNNGGGTQTIQAAEVTLSTSAVAADTLYQGTNTNIIYITKMDVSAMADVTLNNVQYTLSGNHDADDLSYTSIYFNATAPVISGATYLGQTVATFAAPHAYSYYINKFMARGSSGYFIITANVSATATDNKTIRITGATTPVAFSYTTAPNVTNSQNNGGGTQTIQAAEVNLSTSAVAADTLYQGTNTNIIYITKMDVSAMADVTLNNVQYTLSGTHDADDLSYTSIYFNATAPVISGATYLGQTVATFAAPHAYSYYINKFMARGSSGYFIITANVTSTATDNKTVLVNGATTPVAFSYTTAPNITNSQNNGGGTQTIQAAEVTLSTSAVAADTLYQGTNTNIIYITKMDVSAMADVTLNNVQYTLSGTHDADDLSYTSIYFNATAPVISGATYLGQTVATFAAPHAYSYYINKFMARGSSGYFIITANVNTAATDNKTVQVNGATNPVAFSYTTAPNITNAQTNAGGVQTIQAAEVTLTSSAVAAGNIVRGTNTNVVYIAKMDVSAMAGVTLNNIQYTLSGTHDADDITYTSVYFNTTPAITGAIYLGQTAATFAAPHTYSYYINKAMTRGTSGYFLITVNVNAAGTLGNTVQLNGATNPVVFSYTTAPNITNSQTNAAGVKTISAFAPAALLSNNTSSDDAAKGIVINSVYPNPVTALLYVSVKGEAKLLITSQDGFVMAQKTITNNGSIDMSKFKPGLYFIKDAKSGYAVSVIKK